MLNCPNSIVRILLVLSFIISPAKSYAYKPPTHKIINELAAVRSKLFSGDTLDRIGFGNTNGNQQKIIEWVKLGGENEDVPFWRTFNHFHDSLITSWNDSGLPLNQSAVLWALIDEDNEYSYSKALKQTTIIMSI